MLETQKYLATHTLQDLEAEFGIEVTEHVALPLVILNYGPRSRKDQVIPCECRGLCLQKSNKSFDKNAVGDSWPVVARSFTRFFNYGENLAETSKFDWRHFDVQEKVDGSLMLLYFYAGSWRVNTRGSFAAGEINDSGKVWEEVFFENINERALDGLNESYTYVCELCSPYNKIVREYPTTKIFLLTIFNNLTGTELWDDECDRSATKLQVLRPESHFISSLEGIEKYLTTDGLDPTFEGFVLKDLNGFRIKIKNKDYVILHQLRGNGNNLYSPKVLLPFVLAGKCMGVDTDDFKVYFPEIDKKYNEIKTVVDSEYADMLTYWDKANTLEDQKSFALAVKNCKFASVLFTSRKLKVCPLQVWRESAELILKKVFYEI